MIYFYIVLALFLAYVALHRFTDLKTEHKIFSALLIAALVAAFYLFETHNTKQQERNLELTFHFEHNGTLECGSRLVHKRLYNYSVGGHSFLGKKHTRVFGQIIPIDSCEIKK